MMTSKKSIGDMLNKMTNKGLMWLKRKGKEHLVRKLRICKMASFLTQIRLKLHKVQNCQTNGTCERQIHGLMQDQFPVKSYCFY